MLIHFMDGPLLPLLQEEPITWANFIDILNERVLAREDRVFVCNESFSHLCDSSVIPLQTYAGPVLPAM